MFGRLIRSYRSQNKITQIEMAAKLNISSNYLSKIERDIAKPSAIIYEKILSIVISSPNSIEISKNDKILRGLLFTYMIEQLPEDKSDDITDAIYKILKSVIEINSE